MTDSALVKKIQAGDDAALAALVEREYPIVQAQVKKSLRFETHKALVDDAEDVTQDVFLGLVKSIGNVKCGDLVVSWLISITNHKINTHLRRYYLFYNNREKLKTQTEYETSRVSFVPVREIEFDDILSKLPESYRQILDLAFNEGLSLPELASALGISYEAASTRKRRAIKAARELLEG